MIWRKCTMIASVVQWIEAVLHTIESWTCWLLFTFVNIYYMSSFLDSKFLSSLQHSIAETDYCINGCDTLYWTVTLPSTVHYIICTMNVQLFTKLLIYIVQAIKVKLMLFIAQFSVSGSIHCYLCTCS